MKTVTLLAMFFLCSTLSYAQTPSLPSKPALEFEEDNSLPIVYLNVVIDAGSTQDPKEKMGLATVAGRMMLRGTRKHTKTEFNELINQLGGSIDVEVRDEGTVIRGAVLAENLERFLDLLDETVSKPKFTSGELSKLKKEVEGEILERKGNDRTLVQYNFYRFLYNTHPYANPVGGTQKGVAAVNYKDVVNYYAQHFGGRTIRLFGSGAAKPEKIGVWFEGLVEKLTALHPEAQPVVPLTKPELEAGRRTLMVDKPGATQAQVLMGGAGIRPESKDFYPVMLANFVYGGGSFQARMMREIRVKRGWTYGAYQSFRFGQQPKHFAMYIFPKTDDTVPAIDLMTKLFADWVKDGITAEEFNFARDALVNSSPFAYDTSKKRLENKTTEYLTAFPAGYFKDYATHIAAVSLSDIAPALRDFFNPDNLALTVVGDAKKLREPLAKLPGFKQPIVKNYLED